jgi:3-phosphoshikimate 1-carboxyvinyltransferase
MEQLTLQPVRNVEGEIFLPGSKSLSNRALLLAALAEGVTEIHNLLDADDIRRMRDALHLLGIPCEFSDDNTRCVVHGQGGPLVSSRPLEFHLGNAGTALRPLTAILGLGRGSFVLTGDPRMQERPVGDLVEALEQAGASISYLKTPGYPPIKIEASGLRGGKISVRGNVSSQYLSSLLMAAPLAGGDSVISVQGELVSQPYVDLTLGLIESFGGRMENEGFQSFKVPGNQSYRSPGRILIEGDASSASYFFAAAAIKGGRVVVHGLPLASRQGDLQFLSVLEQMGARVRRADEAVEVEAGSPLRGIDVDARHFPDAAMTLAVAALFADGETTIRHIGNWRVKETDRLAAMATELRKTGARVVEGSDFITVAPPDAIAESVIDTYDDHRMAMCFSLLALSDVPVTINDPRCVSKTFPTYFEQFSSITSRSV